MQTRTENKPLLNKMLHLPAYAAFLLNQRLDELVALQLRLGQELNLPLLQYFRDIPTNEIREITRQGLEELLGSLAAGRPDEYLEQSLGRWQANQLPVIDMNDIAAEDIALINYLRKSSFLHFLPGYTADPAELLAIVSEIDLFLLQAQTSATSYYIRLLKEKIDTHTHFIEKITNTSPGIIYVYDVVNNRELYANKATTEFLGFEPEEIKAMGEAFVETLIHVEDLPLLKQYEKDFGTTADGEVRSFKYRIRNKQGAYRWLRTYETVFKRGGDGAITQKIGIAIDVHEQKRIADALKKREEELLEAQEIAHLGSFFWEFTNRESSGSPECAAILEIPFNDFDAFRERVHPADLKKVQAAIEDAMTSGRYECEYRYLGNTREKVIWSRGKVNFRDGKPVSMHGTLMDVTERHHLLERLRKSENMYRHAETLSNIGNWSWDVETGRIEWTDQLYRIYGLEPGSGEITLEKFLSFVHPDDRDRVDAGIRTLMTEKLVDDTFRILTPDGQVRILRSLAQVESDGEGKAVRIIGSESDVTERQNLIDSLLQSEKLYKQAQALAQVGNFSFDLESGHAFWSDELYRIYGLPPSEPVTLQTYIDFIHPDDRPEAERMVRQAVDQRQPLSTTHRILRRNGSQRFIFTSGEIYREDDREVLVGIAQDVTERQELIEKLQRSETLYKQAQALARIGNFAWDLSTNEVIWSDEVYHIYGIPAGTPVQFDSAFTPILPEYQPDVQEAIGQTLALRKGHNVHYAIRTGEGAIKHINLETDVVLNEAAEVTQIIGTAQDITDRQQLIEQLQASERLYKQAQSLVRMGNWAIDLQTDEYTWSDEMFTIYEREPGSRPSIDEWKSFIHPDERADVIAYLEECVREAKPYDRIHRVVLPNGKTKVLHRKSESIVNEQGMAVKLVGTTQDITEQHLMQQALKDNQNFVGKITDATPSIIASYNLRTGQYSFISEGLKKLLGYSVGEAIQAGLPFFMDLVHPDDLAELTELNARAIEEANLDPGKDDFVFEFTYRMRHQKGHYRWFHTYGTIFDRDEDGKVENILNISLDVTEQKDAVQKIAEQEHFIQQIADASPTILYLFDVETQRMEYINREIFFVLGYLPDEILEAADGVTDLLCHPDDFQHLPARRQSRKNFQQVDSMMQYECRLKNKDGELRWFLVREIVFKTDEKGAIKQILGAALDINRRKEMERTILQNTLQLEQSNASLEEFAYVASHDLKEPLRKISTFGDRLMASHAANLTAEGKIYLKKIVEASQRMQTMISDLLSISMISGNRGFEPYSLQKILDETIQTLEFKIEQQNAVIRYDALPEANIIPSQFRQLFQNLLSNSLKFVREGVQPVITIRYSEAGENETAHHHLARSGRYHKIEISDNGIGFENEFAGRIFAIFQRLHGRSEYEGSGIGLAICKKIVEHHGGIIYASGVPGEGALFTLILPA